jgi:hypothetical protein
MDRDALEKVAGLIRRRNAIDADVAAITGRPLVAGHLGEWIASEIFDIQLESSAVAKAIDGRFRSGPLAGGTVNVKWYGKLEGLLDISEDPALDFYLVMTGPRAGAASSRGMTRPLRIESVHVFDAAEVLATPINGESRSESPQVSARTPGEPPKSSRTPATRPTSCRTSSVNCSGSSASNGQPTREPLIERPLVLNPRSRFARLGAATATGPRTCPPEACRRPNRLTLYP